MGLPVIFHILNGSGLNTLQPRNRLQQLLLPAVGDSRDAQHLSPKGREGDVVELQDALGIPHRESLDTDALRGVNGRGPVDVERHLVPDHHVRHLLRGGLGGDHLANIDALAQDYDAVADLLNLVELVRDDNDRLAVIAHVAKNGKELLGLLGRKHGGWLVEDEDVRTPVDELHDLDGLLLGHAHLVDLLV